MKPYMNNCYFCVYRELRQMREGRTAPLRWVHYCTKYDDYSTTRVPEPIGPAIGEDQCLEPRCERYGNVQSRTALSAWTERTVCVDLDGVLSAFGEWRGILDIAKPIPGAQEFLVALRERGFWVVIFCARYNEPIFNCPDVWKDCGLEFAEPAAELPPPARYRLRNQAAAIIELSIHQWLWDNDMPYDDIWTGSGKPLATAYVDDKGISCEPLRAQSSSDFGYALVELDRIKAITKKETGNGGGGGKT